MSDTAQGPIDLDTLTDDEVMNLDPSQIQALMDQENAADEPVVETPDADDDLNADDNALDDDDADATAEAERVAAEEAAALEAAKLETPPGGDDTEIPATPKEDDQSPEGTPEGEKPVKKAEVPAPKAEDKAPVEDKTKKADAPVTAEVKAATEFYTEITKPFKADGKDFQVKTASEAIRLMQMGANYSRRMQEMKPLKAMDAVLKEHGLDNPDKLAQLIDIQKGDPAAIQKLLKDKGIDPLDIDVSKATTYTAKAYTADEKALNFKEAIDNTMAIDGGKELIADMHGKWDNESKDALYETPAIFESMLSQKSAVDSAKVSDYSKINAEVERQRVLGYLTDVPFLQAYTQVSDAMANIDGLLTSSKKSNPAVPAKAPIDTGVRKAAPKPKTELPNPTLSSTPPKAAPSPAAENETDYATLTDEAFMALGVPG